MHPKETHQRDLREETASAARQPAAGQPSPMALDDCLDFVWRLARDGGLPPDQAADVCSTTLLRLGDEFGATAALSAKDASWVLRVAVEECRTSRRLAAWRRPRLVGFESTVVGAKA